MLIIFLFIIKLIMNFLKNLLFLIFSTTVNFFLYDFKKKQKKKQKQKQSNIIFILFLDPTNQFIKLIYSFLINLFLFLFFTGEILLELICSLMENEELVIISSDVPQTRPSSSLFNEFSSIHSENSEDSEDIPARNSWFENYIKIPLKSLLSKMGLFVETNSVSTKSPTLISTPTELISITTEPSISSTYENMSLSSDSSEIKKSWFHYLFISPFEYFFQKLGFCRENVIDTTIPESILEPSVPAIPESILEPSVSATSDTIVSRNTLQIDQIILNIDNSLNDLNETFENSNQIINNVMMLSRSSIREMNDFSTLISTISRHVTLIDGVLDLRISEIKILKDLLQEYEKIAPKTEDFATEFFIDAIKTLQEELVNDSFMFRESIKVFVKDLYNFNPANLDKYRSDFDNLISSTFENCFVRAKQMEELSEIYFREVKHK